MWGEKKQFRDSDRLQIQWIMPAILGCTDRNMTSRIKQVMAPDKPSPKGNMDKIKAPSEEGSQTGDVLEKPVEISGIHLVFARLYPGHLSPCSLCFLFTSWL